MSSGRITAMAATPTPDLAVPYEAPRPARARRRERGQRERSDRLVHTRRAISSNDAPVAFPASGAPVRARYRERRARADSAPHGTHPARTQLFRARASGPLRRVCTASLLFPACSTPAAPLPAAPCPACAPLRPLCRCVRVPARLAPSAWPLRPPPPVARGAVVPHAERTGENDGGRGAEHAEERRVGRAHLVGEGRHGGGGARGGGVRNVRAQVEKRRRKGGRRDEEKK